jgi:hypothetical protein
MGFRRIMQKKAVCFFSLAVMAWLSFLPVWGTSVIPYEGDAHFEKKDYVEAIADYERQYAAGQYSEQMLYRMAFIHENMDQPAEAAYFLKKAQAEYGSSDPELPGRIRKLMRLAGTDHFFTQDDWISWRSFYRQWGLPINAVMLAATAFLLLILLRKQLWKRPTVRYVAGFASIALLLSLLLNGYNLLMGGERAVVVKPTACYKEPGFSSSNSLTAIGLAETVKVVGHQDIWVQVDAGAGAWWVPGWALRTL